ncbi:LytR C-terminal domain-containing protein [Streptomyces sp. 6N223]|uniref:LytR C-terminal domain-containing protein n=1 Tax=Streptomyces sp. 6N223 TaxID=3457412 RepID=UPI003FCF3369
MSMLTPPGMRGRKYRITGNRYPRMRPRPRRRRNLLLVVAAAALVGLLSYGTLQLVGVFTAEDDEGTGPASAEAGASRPGACGPPAEDPDRPDLPAVLPEPETITVNVYNATTRTGLAQNTADALALRGFTIGEVANAPARLDGKVEEPGLLLATTRAAESGAVAVVGTHLKGAETGEPKPSGGRAEVDLVLGTGFTELLSPRDAARELEALASPSPAPDQQRGEADC